jgi:hypothetical protein
MTSTADYAVDHMPTKAVVHVLDASRLLLRVGLRFGAISCALVAVFIWLAPGASWESELMLYKLGLSSAAALLALACWQAAAPPLPPSVEIDVARGELRLVREGAPAPERVIKRTAFADLQIVELRGRNLAFWEKGGNLLAEVTLCNASAHAALLQALRSAGKLD